MMTIWRRKLNLKGVERKFPLFDLIFQFFPRETFTRITLTRWNISDRHFSANRARTTSFGGGEKRMRSQKARKSVNFLLSILLIAKFGSCEWKLIFKWHNWLLGVKMEKFSSSIWTRISRWIRRWRWVIQDALRRWDKWRFREMETFWWRLAMMERFGDGIESFSALWRLLNYSSAL